MPTAIGSAQESPGPVASPPEGVAQGVSLPDMIAGVMPAVVEVRAQTAFGTVGGTGIVVGADGVILTSHHIVRDATSVRVVLRPGATRPGSRPVLRMQGRVIDRSPGRDIALIRVPLRGLATIPLRATPGPRLGEEVVAIGFALSIPGKPTVSRGIIAGLGRSLPVSRTRFLRHLIQTDAALNPGNSGGPLLDGAGRLLGLNAAVIADGYTQNIGFAVDVRQAAPMIRKATRQPTG
jgi:S1-C subfamily serine protease